MVVKWVITASRVRNSHFSPYLFTRILLPILTKTSMELGSDVRTVTVSKLKL